MEEARIKLGLMWADDCFKVSPTCQTQAREEEEGFWRDKDTMSTHGNGDLFSQPRWRSSAAAPYLLIISVAWAPKKSGPAFWVQL